jgi:Ribbon-helix-helix domain
VRVYEIFKKPMTTPEFPDVTEHARYIRDDDGFYGYDYVFLEDFTWHALCQIARAQGRTVDELCGDIDLNFAPGEDFSPAAPLCAAHYRIPDRNPDGGVAARALSP